MKEAKNCIETTLIVFLKKKKILIQGKWVILNPKIMCRRNSGLTVRIFKNFVQLKGPRGIWKLYQWFIWEKIYSEQMGHFGPKMMCRHSSGSALTVFLKFCTMKRVKRYMKIISMVFLKKLSLAQLGHFWLQNDMLL